MQPISFEVVARHGAARAGIIHTPHGDIETPAFVVVGTKGTVKSLTPEQVTALGTEVILANTYHLYLQPGDELVRNAGGIHRFMNWDKPTMTDSGGFQAFSLGAAYGHNISKIASGEENVVHEQNQHTSPAKITEDGVSFRSAIDGSSHLFTPERSVEIQHNIGADMIFAFDECTSPHASFEYQREAMDRTHRWARRSLLTHKTNSASSQKQGLFGIVQGGRFEDLRKESARIIGSMDFDGFGIGGSFNKEDMHTAVGWVNELLPPDRPRHLLGIGEPQDLVGAVANGCDLFDCVAPTRMARNGTLHTKQGRMNILNAKFTRDFTPIEEGCACYTCTHYTRAYVAHLFRAKEMLAATLASIHNLHFIVHFVKDIRHSIVNSAQ